eukprot:4220006-Pyramimonas_sp.AAC.1
MEILENVFLLIEEHSIWQSTDPAADKVSPLLVDLPQLTELEPTGERGQALLGQVWGHGDQPVAHFYQDLGPKPTIHALVEPAWLHAGLL